MTKCTWRARPSSPVSSTSTFLAAETHWGYAGKSAITAMTSAAGASMTIDWVDWSAMRRRVVAPSLRPARFQGAGAPGGWHVLLPSRSVGIDLVHRPRVRVQGRRRPWLGGAERTGVRELSVPPTATVGPDDA